MDILPIDFTTASVKIDLVDSEETTTLPDVANDPEDEDDRDSEHLVEEALDIGEAAAGRADGSEELSGEDKNAEAETDVSTSDAEDSSVRKFIEGVALGSPGLAEADVGEANRAPGEQSGERGHGQQPAKDITAAIGHLDVSKTTEGQVNENGGQWSTRFVDVGEDLRSVTLLSKSGKSARAGKSG